MRDCSKHPQSFVWESSSGPRCAICGELLIGDPPRPEPAIVRTFDFFQSQIDCKEDVAFIKDQILIVVAALHHARYPEEETQSLPELLRWIASLANVRKLRLSELAAESLHAPS